MNQEIIISSSDKEISAKITSLKKEGKIRKIATRIYTSNLLEEPADIIKRNSLELLSALYPEAILSHRSAFEMKPTDNGHIFATYKYTKNIILPGLTIHLLAGHEATNNDIRIGNLCRSSEERAYLENMQQSRESSQVSKCLSKEEIEKKLQKKLVNYGEDGLNEFRDRCRIISEDLNMDTEFNSLNNIIGALLNTRPSGILYSATSKAWANGEPYDSDRINLFEILFNALYQIDFFRYQDINQNRISKYNISFFESYFSNYIEGTRFELDVAKDIVDSKKVLPLRHDDSHDILGTFELVSDIREMSRTPSSADEYIETLKYRHKRILRHRTYVNPGSFKTKNNMAGNSHFVDYRLVEGTLKKGYEIYSQLNDPVAKAYMMMFITSEVHPFDDGNGRISRIMMNSELVSSGLPKIIIPNVFRIDYIDALKRLTQKNDSDTYIRAMERARLYSSMLDGNDFDNLVNFFKKTNAFFDDQEHILIVPLEKKDRPN